MSNLFFIHFSKINGLKFYRVRVQVIALVSWVKYQEPTFNRGEYEYPPWAIAVGWLFACCSIVPIPVGMVVMVYLTPGDTLLQVMLGIPSFR